MSNGTSVALSNQMLGQVPDIVRQNAAKDELGAGISSGFAVLSVRGKVWRVKHRGEERPLTQTTADGRQVPRHDIEVVLIKAGERLSKIYYEGGYTDGSSAPPSCWSANGMVPDPSAPALQAGKTGPSCVSCWANAWGSRGVSSPGAAGSKGKACSDSKRIAVVPLADLNNEAFGGPMLLRVPPASLRDVAAYSDGLKGMGYPFYAVATRISFDMNAEFPKLHFTPIRVLNEEEVHRIMEYRGELPGTSLDARVERMLSAQDAEVQGETPAQPAPGLQFEQKPIPQEVKTQQEVENRIKQNVQTFPEPKEEALPEGWVELPPGGKWYHPKHGITDQRPTAEPEKPADPYEGMTPLPDGKYYDPKSGSIIDPNATAEPEKPKRTRSMMKGKVAEPAKEATPQKAAEPEPPLEQPTEEENKEAGSPDWENHLSDLLGKLTG